MKWIKLSDELPPFDTEIVLLSERGFTRLAFRKTQERMDMLDAKLCDIARRFGVTRLHLFLMIKDCHVQADLNTSGNIGVCFPKNRTEKISTRREKYERQIRKSYRYNSIEARR